MACFCDFFGEFVVVLVTETFYTCIASDVFFLVMYFCLYVRKRSHFCKLIACAVRNTVQKVMQKTELTVVWGFLFLMFWTLLQRNVCFEKQRFFLKSTWIVYLGGDIIASDGAQSEASDFNFADWSSRPQRSRFEHCRQRTEAFRNYNISIRVLILLRQWSWIYVLNYWKICKRLQSHSNCKNLCVHTFLEYVSV